MELRRAAAPAAPAAWTRLELWLGSQRLAEGLAGADGQALLVFPLPKPREVPFGVSPAEASERFEWTVELHAFRSAAVAASKAASEATVGGSSRWSRSSSSRLSRRPCVSATSSTR